MTRAHQIASLLQQSREAFQTFCADNGIRGAVFFPGLQAGDNLRAAWREYIANVAHPLNEQILFLFLQMFPWSRVRPPIITDLEEYVNAYSSLLEEWEFDNRPSTPDHIGINFPSDLDQFVARMIAEVPAEGI